MLSYLNLRANIGLFHFSFSIRSLVPLLFTPPSPNFSYRECFYYLFPKFFCWIWYCIQFLKLIDPGSTNVILRDYDTGADPEFFCEGGQRGGALIIMVWAWLRNITRKRGRCIRGLGLRPSLLSCYFGAFSYHQRDIRHRPL